MRISLTNTCATVFKICLSTRHFDSSVSLLGIFRLHLVNSSKFLKKHLIANDLNEVELSSMTKSFFKSLVRKCRQNIPCGQTDE